MNPFRYVRAADPQSAIGLVAQNPGAAFIAGGTTILDLMKETVEQPAMLVDINALPLRSVRRNGATIAIGALARMSDVADDLEVAEHAPAVVEALRQSASAQLRNMASIGGNLLQRTRCAYFRDVVTPCNKRSPGQGCAALHGENGHHAILGASGHCIAVNPSDLAVALAAVDATVVIVSRGGERRVPIADFYLLPAETPHVENVITSGELITAVEVPLSPAAARSGYLKVRDRSSYEFALVSVAAGLYAPDRTIADVRIALGGVAPKPWRSIEAERAIVGSPANEDAFGEAAEILLQGALGRGHNDFKIPLAKKAIVRALLDLGAPR